MALAVEWRWQSNGAGSRMALAVEWRWQSNGAGSRMALAVDLRRQLAQDAQRSTTRVTMADLRWFSETFADLADPEVMGRAWG